MKILQQVVIQYNLHVKDARERSSASEADLLIVLCFFNFQKTRLLSENTEASNLFPCSRANRPIQIREKGQFC